MYMRYLGGGVGHRGIGVTVEESLGASARVKQKRAPRRDAASAAGSDSDAEDPQAELPLGSSSDSGDDDLPWRAKDGAREGDDDDAAEADPASAQPSDAEDAMDARSGGVNSAAGTDAEGGGRVRGRRGRGCGRRGRLDVRCRCRFGWVRLDWARWKR